MKGILLAFGVIVFFTYIFFIMKKVDLFIEECISYNEKIENENRITIAFENLSMYKAFDIFLEKLINNSNYNIQLYYGNKEDILNKIKNQKLDICFLYKDILRIDDEILIAKTIKVEEKDIFIKDVEMPIRVFNNDYTRIFICYRKNEKNKNILNFVEEISCF